MAKKRKSCKFPIKTVREIFPNATVKHAKHTASLGEWERKNFLYIYGEARKSDYPKENKILQRELKKWAKCKRLIKKR